MKSLSEFAAYRQVFRNAIDLPPFFDSNLVDPGRVVNAFYKDPQAHIRIFYYQYLRLCFQLQTPKSQGYLHKLEEILNNSTFQFYFFEDDDPRIFNDANAKSLIFQFFQFLASGKNTVLSAVNNNPIMDLILVHFFRTLLVLTMQTDELDNFLPRQALVSYLCTFFGVDVQFYGVCCHYVESDIFVYEEEDAVYMAYIAPFFVQNEEAQNKEKENRDVLEPIVPPRTQLRNIPVEVKQPEKQSFIDNQFIHYNNLTQNLQLRSKTSPNNLKENNNARVETISSNQFTSSNVQSSSNLLTKPMAFIETVSIGASSETKSISKLISQSGKWQVEPKSQAADSSPKSVSQIGSLQLQQLMRSNQITRGQVTYIEFEEIPQSKSVGPTQPQFAGFSAATAYQPSIYPSTTNRDIVPSQVNKYHIPNKYSSSLSKVQKIMPSQPPPPALADSKRDLIYNPKFQKTAYIHNPYAPESFIQHFESKSTVAQAGGTKSLTVAAVKKKQAFDLNITDEFTNSFTQENMNQPYKSNVQAIKARARKHRASLATYIK